MFVCIITTFTKASFEDSIDLNFECSLANRPSIRTKLHELKVLWAIFVTFSTNEETLFGWTSPEIENLFLIFNPINKLLNYSLYPICSEYWICKWNKILLLVMLFSLNKRKIIALKSFPTNSPSLLFHKNNIYIY